MGVYQKMPMFSWDHTYIKYDLMSLINGEVAYPAMGLVYPHSDFIVRYASNSLRQDHILFING
jgi:hypothetical protein